MVDCGLFQGLKELRTRNWAPLPVSAQQVNGVILTHAHIDHAGYVPLLVKQNFRGKIYGSEPTIDLCKIMLPDCGYIQEEDARFASRHGFSKHHTPIPLYTHDDAVRSLSHLQSLHNGQIHKLGRDMRVRLIQAGHILGARFVEVTLDMPKRRKILFGGDIGRYDALIATPPLRVPEADYLVLEATYGDKLHPKENIYVRMAEIINSTAARGGKIMIPAFAVGRTQELLYILQKLQRKNMISMDLPIYLNTPLGINATEIYARYLDEHKAFSGLGNGVEPGVNPFYPHGLHLVHDHQDSKALNELAGPAIIIAGSGMLTGGRMLHHLKTHGGDENSTLILVGYQAEGTRGRHILDGANHLKIHGENFPIRCNVETIESLSAHGDQDDIMRWLGGFRRPPKKTFLVHGERTTAERLANRIREELHWNVEIPQYLHTEKLD